MMFKVEKKSLNGDKTITMKILTFRKTNAMRILTLEKNALLQSQTALLRSLTLTTSLNHLKIYMLIILKMILL
jgi:hypothetical protein